MKNPTFNPTCRESKVDRILKHRPTLEFDVRPVGIQVTCHSRIDNAHPRSSIGYSSGDSPGTREVRKRPLRRLRNAASNVYVATPASSRCWDDRAHLAAVEGWLAARPEA